MTKTILFFSAFSLFTAGLQVQTSNAKETADCTNVKNHEIHNGIVFRTDTVPPADVMDVITTVVYATNTFNIEAVANLYTPNAVIADDEPPYSWNGPTAGVQWVNAVEEVCKDNKLTKLKGTIASISVFQQNADNVYIIVPVNYTGYLPGKAHFTAEGAFTFVLRMINGKWLIKSQAWMPKKGM